jgi:hypothetical protein
MEGMREKFAKVEAQEEVAIGIEDVSKGIRRMIGRMWTLLWMWWMKEGWRLSQLL